MDSSDPPYAELQVTSHFSFLRGGSSVEELVIQAEAYGLAALAVTDRNSLAGIARAHRRALEAGVRLVVGCRLDLADGLSLLVYPTDRAAYGRLCRLLSLGKERAGKGGCTLHWADVAAWSEGLLAVLLPGTADELPERLQALRRDFPGRCYMALTLHRRPGDAVRLRLQADAAQAAGVPCVVTGDVLYHIPQRRPLQDVLSCVREGCTIDELGFRRERTADRHMKPPAEMARLFKQFPEAFARTTDIVERCRFSLSDLRYQYPDEAEGGVAAQARLERLVAKWAPSRYPGGVPAAVEEKLRHELALIAQLDYAPYFLTVFTIVEFARSKKILCQGRGSAANSAVCYVLHITAIDPVESGLLFERFVSAARREPPDIDVDFEHERREEVIQWIYQHYGLEHAALCSTVISYRARGALRDVGKALGLPEDVTAALSRQAWGWSTEGVTEEQAAELNLDPSDRRLQLTLQMARELIGFPRHLSQHPGGFVLTRDRLDELVPIEPASMADRQVIEWDKDDIDYLRFMKVDVLGLGMLGCMRRAFDLLVQHGRPAKNLATIPSDDADTFAMIQKADTLGTFQIESRAQMSMLPRLKPNCFYDLVIQVAIVRPGPIQGDMVHPYLRRRDRLETPEYPTEKLRAVLEKTLGVPLFQEQAMQVAMVCAGFSATEADELRRSMATFKVTGGVHHFRDKLIAGMLKNGYKLEFAERTFSQIEGFGSYGFPESHAASFARIAYASAWMKCHHPDVFACALLNAQPMGFYAPAQIVRDAVVHGVAVRPVCVNASAWDCTLEQAEGRFLALRLGLRMAKGFSEVEAEALVKARGEISFASLEDVWRRSGLPVAALERLADADAYRALPDGASGLAELKRRPAAWTIRGLRDTALPLFAAAEAAGAAPADGAEPEVALAPMAEGREVVEDYHSTGLTLRRHPVWFLREGLRARGMIQCADLVRITPGRRVTVPGIVLVRQRPGSAKGVMFITVEDETGFANVIVWPKVFEAQRRIVLSATMLGCTGRLQREGAVIHVVAEKLHDLSGLLRSVGERDADFPVPSTRGDEAKRPNLADSRDRREIKVETRDFR